MLYPCLRSLLFRLSAETAHDVTLKLMRSMLRGPVPAWLQSQVAADPVTVMGLNFPNRIGLAAGLDKNGDYIDALSALGFGFIEIGTVTPRPQDGNPRPRLFRLAAEQAIINRLGFNNKGIDYLLEQVKRTRYQGILGINIGKNKDTPAAKSIDDYVYCMKKAYAFAGYLTINISSPNTPGLRDLQNEKELDALLSELTGLRTALAAEARRHVPLVLKVAPDLSQPQIENIARTVSDHAIDGLIVSNTTLTRPGIEGQMHAHENGGLSGKPLMPLATQTLHAFAQCLQGRIPLIGVGGILNAEDALTKIKAGATLVQIYSGLIYQGPQLIRDISRALANQKSRMPH